MKDWNLGWEDEYAQLDELADPIFIEPKGYVFVGDSRTRMTIDNMPSHASVSEFSLRLAEMLSLDLLAEREDSRVVLVGRQARQAPREGLSSLQPDGLEVHRRPASRSRTSCRPCSRDRST